MTMPHHAALASVYGAIICTQCHPPADAAQAAAREGED